MAFLGYALALVLLLVSTGAARRTALGLPL
jgi:hypothetical protein